MDRSLSAPRTLAGAFLILGVALAAALLHDSPDFGARASFTLISGLAFGVLLQRSRFCFFCILRDFFERRQAAGLIGILAALAAGSIGYTVIFGAWLVDPTVGRLPAEAHIGPVSWPLALAGLVFGIGMTLSGSCISAHLYRLGEGSVRAPFALLGVLIGFALGYLTWEPLYLAAISEAPILWLPRWLGYGGALALHLAVFAGLALFLVRFLPARPAGQVWTAQRALEAVLVNRWPVWVGGIGIGILGTFTYLRTDPLGVTAQLGWLARLGAEQIGVLAPGRLPGLDGFAGCATKPEDGLLTQNGLFVLALIAGALAAALPAGEFRPTRPRLRSSATALLGGVFMGWGSMIALGCTLGTLLSGISAFALSGWVFTLALVLGVYLSLKVARRFAA